MKFHFGLTSNLRHLKSFILWDVTHHRIYDAIPQGSITPQFNLLNHEFLLINIRKFSFCRTGNTLIVGGHLLSLWFLAQLIFFDPEDGGDMFFRNVG
jgi:hypothetical protein